MRILSFYALLLSTLLLLVQYLDGVSASRDCLLWGIQNAEAREPCDFFPVNSTDPELQKIGKLAQNSSDLALIFHYIPGYDCKWDTGKDIAQSVDKLEMGLRLAGFPGINLYILTSDLYDRALLGDDYLIYNSLSPLQNHMRTTLSDVAVLDLKSIYTNPSLLQSNRDNDPTWNVYKGLFLALTALVLLYAWIRVIVLWYYKELEFNMLMWSFLVSTAFSICSIIDSFWGYNSPILLDGVAFVCSFLSKLPFDLILWHWSIVGSNLFSKRSIIIFRVFVIIDLLANIARTIYMIVIITKFLEIKFDESKIKRGIDSASPYMITILALDTAMFAGFTIWFGTHAYKLRRHPVGYYRLLQLAFFALMGFLVYLVLLLCASISRAVDFKAIFRMEFAFDVTYLSRALVFMAVLGVIARTTAFKGTTLTSPTLVAEEGRGEGGGEEKSTKQTIKSDRKLTGRTIKISMKTNRTSKD
ncbi:hypothetical protein BDF22DRAFT_693976 [Syncephalis plumigaleata]|nr:hypothetical protein BDF22DRAFT_693976 [Syncephalis plumigaleata]